ncbi:MAG: YbjQ family protein [Hellea sp.]|nr:YbjQ family protein [Hellea sp.]
MAGLITFLVLLLVGLIFGRINESRHFAILKRDEEMLSDIMTVNLKRVPDDLQQGAVLVGGNVVVAVDYFKKIVAGLKQLIGGRLKTYETLVERARREAIVRMKKDAREIGANAIYNVRIEFSSIGSQPRQAFGGVELFAYGTAVKF